MKFILFLLYRYYDKGSTKEIAYEHAILSIMLLLFINIFTFLTLFDLGNILPYNASYPRGLQYLKDIVIIIFAGVYYS